MTHFASLAGVCELRKTRIRVLQLNVGDSCSLACQHCFASAGPSGDKIMQRQTLEAALTTLETNEDIAVVDITGGSPELLPDMPWLLRELRITGRQITFRSNLVALETPNGELLLELLLSLRAEIVASLPGLDAATVDAQRGQGVFDRSIAVLRRLNALGYGSGAAPLSLMVNPTGFELPRPQVTLETLYRERLARDHGLRFDRLYSLPLVPLGRWARELRRQQRYNEYLHQLRRRHCPAALERVMCRDTLTVAHDGRLYDCELNRAAGLPLVQGPPQTIAALAEHGWPRPEGGIPVAVADHCFVCTAGSGFS